MNFTNAIVVGAAAGAGGIGYKMFMAGRMYFDSREIGFFVLFNIFSESLGFFISAEPSLFLTTLLTGQPILKSIISKSGNESHKPRHFQLNLESPSLSHRLLDQFLL